MNNIVKEKWLSALRSGEYKQGKNLLHGENTFCCLGVLCDLHSKEFKKDWTFVSEKEGSGLLHQEAHYDYLNATQFLPAEVTQWAGLIGDSAGYASAGIFMKEGEQCFLSTLNDDGKSFSEIADVIEKHL